MGASNGKPLRKVRDFLQLPLLYDYWYVVGLTEEFGRELMAKTLLERSVVFYRRTDGSLAALQNRCAHRSFPLSKSTLIGDDIQCGYHGIRYNSDGEIVDVPCQSRCPATKLRKYPVAERGPLVWIWMGAEDHADEADIPETDCLTEPNWAAMWGRSSIEGNYLLMHENLADLSHLPYTHAKTFGTSSGWAEVPVEVEREGDKVHYWRSTQDWSMASNLFPPSVDCDDRKIEAKLGGTFETPAMCRGWNRIEVVDAREGEQRRFDNEIIHYLTPKTRNSAHYYWSLARNCDIGNAEFTQQFKEVVAAAFDEDRVAVNDMQELLEEDTSDLTDLGIAGDKSSAMVRRVFVDIAGRV